MRILHLVSYSIYSGPVPPTAGLALAQRALGHDVWLAYDTKRGNFNGYEEPAKPRLEELSLSPPCALSLSTKSSPVEMLRDALALRHLIAKAEVDVVHAHLSHAHMLLALAYPAASAIACVRTFHSARSLERRFGQAALNRRADACILRCTAHRERLEAEFAIPEERLHVIPAGIDPSQFPPATAEAREQARVRFGLPSDAFVVTHVALIARRGQEELVRALTLCEVAQPHLLFVGRGEAEPELRRLCAELGLESRVHFAGYLHGPELRAAYAAADLAFLAQAGNDASARAALEASSAGVPLCAVADDALGELVSAERGYPIASREPADIARALDEAARRPDERDRLGRRARDHLLATRSLETEAKRTFAAYEQASETAALRQSRRLYVLRAVVPPGIKPLLGTALLLAACALAFSALFFFCG